MSARPQRVEGKIRNTKDRCRGRRRKCGEASKEEMSSLREDVWQRSAARACKLDFNFVAFDE
eukprot:11219658-Karenia_brevis.AAC.1